MNNLTLREAMDLGVLMGTFTLEESCDLTIDLLYFATIISTARHEESFSDDNFSDAPCFLWPAIFTIVAEVNADLRLRLRDFVTNAAHLTEALFQEALWYRKQ
jgi:hypothetical protein